MANAFTTAPIPIITTCAIYLSISAGITPLVTNISLVHIASPISIIAIPVSYLLISSLGVAVDLKLNVLSSHNQ